MLNALPSRTTNQRPPNGRTTCLKAATHWSGSPARTRFPGEAMVLDHASEPKSELLSRGSPASILGGRLLLFSARLAAIHGCAYRLSDPPTRAQLAKNPAGQLWCCRVEEEPLGSARAGRLLASVKTADLLLQSQRPNAADGGDSQCPMSAKLDELPRARSDTHLRHRLGDVRKVTVVVGA